MDARSPFACLLLGQPTLRRRIKLGTLAALDQRIALRYHLDGMDLGETVSYLTHHLKLAGRSDTIFTDDAIGLLHQTSRGIPRAVNNLALQALVAAFADGKGTVDESAAAPPSPKSPATDHTRDPNPVPTATIPAVGTTTPRPDHDHAHSHPTGRPARITSGTAAPITNEAVAQQEHRRAHPHQQRPVWPGPAPGPPLALLVPLDDPGHARPRLPGRRGPDRPHPPLTTTRADRPDLLRAAAPVRRPARPARR